MISKIITTLNSNKKFAFDTIWLIVSQGVVIVCGFLIIFLITKYLGLIELGYYNQLVSFYNILSIVFALGLNNTIIKNISEKPDDVNYIQISFTNSLVMTIIQSLVFSVFIFLLLRIFPELFSSKTLKDFFILILIALPIYNINKNIDALCTGTRNQKKFSINKIIRWIAMTVLVGIGCYYKDIKIVLLSFIVSELLLLIFNFQLVCKYTKMRINQDFIISNFKFGISTYFAEMISVIIANIDLIILGYILSKYDIGLYSLILTIARTLLIFPGILSQNINPITAKLWYEHKKEELFEKFKKINFLNFWISLLLYMVLLLLYWVVISMYKTEYSSSYLYFIIAITGIFISSTITWSGGTFVMIGKNKLNNIRTFSLSIISIAFTYFGAIQFGLLGACIAVLINGTIQYIVILGLLLKLKNNKL
jgi:O-antigen/teichoic acid export membrane protein